ncbi:MAG: hypothetical protein FWE71_05170 [Nocardioidaceae bacterium]|nr:hypothetical protein [Nocardioidaceae bacterium]MCL2613300.1 hypothetical protein [Nocardioidaceae bacterium]
MRSAGDVGIGQEPLPFDPPPAAPVGVRRRPLAEPLRSSYRLGAELARSRGWPEGTELVVEPGRRPAPGDVVVVREQGAERAGVFQHRFGRPVLVSDRGVGWIGPQIEVLGVATLVAAALDVP